MISIRKYLDAGDAVAAPPSPASQPFSAGGDTLAICLEAYRGTLCGIGRASVDACPAEGIALDKSLGAIVTSLTSTPSTEAIAAAGESATNEVRNWGLSTARHYRQKAAEVREILLAMTSAAESVSKRDQHCARRFHQVTENLRNIASLDDISQIRTSLERSAAELKGSIDRMTSEGKAVLDRLQSQVATFEAKLAEAEQLVSVDFLTRLRSRSWIEGQIEQRIAAATSFCVALLDLDGFKLINDEHGHVAGDDVLRQFAAELKSACRSTDLVGRWGGDEFLVLLDCPIAQARAQIERVSKWVCGTYTINRDCGPLVLMIRASIGLAEFSVPDSITQLLHRADAAMATAANRLNAEVSKHILESIEDSQPELALSIRNLMFTFEDLVTVPPATIREIVSGVDKRQLALALRGANDELRAQIFKAMSSRAVEMLKEDMEVLGPVRSREVAQAQQEILNLARRLEAEGKVILKLETGEEMLA